VSDDLVYINIGLRYIGYILNLIIEEYLFKQDYNTFKKEFKKARAPKQQAL
jgi:hypothetical protein